MRRRAHEHDADDDAHDAEAELATSAGPLVVGREPAAGEAAAAATLAMSAR
jgi:hypothetical protein